MHRAWVVVGLAACSGATDPGVQAFVAGEGDVFTAIVGDSSAAMAYRCDGDPASATVSHWFTGGVDEDGGFVLTGPAGTVEGAFGDGSVELTVDGAAVAAEPVDPAADDVGLFRAEGEVDGEPFVAGWILDPSGEQRGAIGLSTSGTLFGVVGVERAADGVLLEVSGVEVEVDVFNVASTFGT